MLGMLLLLVKCLLLLSNCNIIGGSPINNIMMTKCCENDTFYLQGFDSCRNDSAQSVISWPPTVYSEDLNRINNDITADGLKITTKMDDCPDGQIAVSTTQFKFIIDGSLRLNEDGRTFQIGQFCLSQVFGSDEEIVARFCAPDPCIEMKPDSAGCLRKCCPIGMKLNGYCQPSSSPSFDIQFRNELGEPIDRNLSSYVIRDSVTPKCVHGLNGLRNPLDDPFYILPDARIYISAYPNNDRFVSEYCIDMESSNGSDVVETVALICFPEQENEDTQLVLSIYPYIAIFSSLFLIATFIVYCILPEIRSNVHGVSVMCFIASLTSFYIGMSIIQLFLLPATFCLGIAIFVQFSMLSTFTWLNVLSYDIFSTFRALQTGTNIRQYEQQLMGRLLCFYFTYAWGVPLLIVITGQILDNVNDLPSHIIKPGFGKYRCWFEPASESLSAHLYGPITALIIINIGFFILTTVMLCRNNRINTTSDARKDQARQKFRAIFSLFLLMGISWMMEVISFWVGGSAYIWIIPDIINICSGIFIFVMFVLLKPNVFRLLKIKYPCFKRLNPYCPSFMLEETNTQHGGKKPGDFPHEQGFNTTTNFMSEDINNGRNVSTTEDITQICDDE